MVGFTSFTSPYDFNRTPVVPDMIINAAEGLAQEHKPLQTNTF